MQQWEVVLYLWIQLLNFSKDVMAAERGGVVSGAKKTDPPMGQKDDHKARNSSSVSSYLVCTKNLVIFRTM